MEEARSDLIRIFCDDDGHWTEEDEEELPNSSRVDIRINAMSIGQVKLPGTFEIS